MYDYNDIIWFPQLFLATTIACIYYRTVTFIDSNYLLYLLLLIIALKAKMDRVDIF